MSKLVLSKNHLLATIGLTAMNSYYASKLEHYHKINAKQIIFETGKGKKVGFIGHFPFLDEQENEFKKLLIFEKNPIGKDLYESDILGYLPQVEVVALTGATISNHTFFKIINYISKDAFVIVLGPSTPMCSQLFKMGVDVISGTKIIDYKLAKEDVMNNIEMRRIRGKEMVTVFSPAQNTNNTMRDKCLT